MVKIREAERKDCPIILQFIKELAEYEKEPDAVEATIEILEESIFEKQQAKNRRVLQSYPLPRSTGPSDFKLNR